MAEKKVGYSLLITGLTVMIIAAISVVGVFTGRFKPVQVFSFEGVGLDPSALMPQMQALQNLPGSKEVAQPAKKVEIVSGEMINQSANLFAHLTLMGFLLSLGGKIASLGSELLRPIIVKAGKDSFPAEQS